MWLLDMQPFLKLVICLTKLSALLSHKVSDKHRYLAYNVNQILTFSKLNIKDKTL